MALAKYALTGLDGPQSDFRFRPKPGPDVHTSFLRICIVYIVVY